MITRIVNENFKSYAGIETLGPFHKVCLRFKIHCSLRRCSQLNSMVNVSCGPYQYPMFGKFRFWPDSENSYRVHL